MPERVPVLAVKLGSAVAIVYLAFVRTERRASRSGYEHSQWRKSTLSATNGCIELAFIGDRIALRDSKQRRGPVLKFTAVEWDAFIGGVRDGEFDLSD